MCQALGSVVRAWDVRDVSDQVHSMGAKWVKAGSSGREPAQANYLTIPTLGIDLTYLAAESMQILPALGYLHPQGVTSIFVGIPSP